MTLVSRDPEALRKAWQQMEESMEHSANLKMAKTIDKVEMTTVPFTVLGERVVGSKNTRFVVVMVGPFTVFPDFSLDYHTLDDGRAYIDAIRDARVADIKTKDNAEKRSITDYPIEDIDDVVGLFDPECKHSRLRKRFVEGDILEMRDETAGGTVQTGMVCLAAVEPLFWHSVKDKLYRIGSNLKIKRLLTNIQMPIGDFVQWMAKGDLATRRFETEFTRYLEAQENNMSDADLKNEAYRDNIVTIITGLPNDYTHPRFMGSNTCMLLNETETESDKSFFIEDYQTKINKPTLALQYKGMQWRGERSSPKYDKNDVLFAVFPSLYTEHIASLDISNTDNWKKLMGPVCDMLQGIYVGKENAKTGASTQLNQERVLAAKGSWDEKTRFVNGPTGDGNLSFSLQLSTIAFIFDPVVFIRSVCPRVTPTKIKERWGGRSTPKALGGASTKQFNSSSMLVCLSEINPTVDLQYVFDDPRYEFRVFTTATPTKKREKRDAYAALSALQPEEGDQFLTYFVKCLLTGDDEWLQNNEDVSENHPIRRYAFKAQGQVEYFFAINVAEWNRKRETALGLMGKISNIGLLEGPTGSLKRTASVAEIEDKVETKRQRTDDPDAIDIDQKGSDDDDEEEEDEDDEDEDGLL